MDPQAYEPDTAQQVRLEIPLGHAPPLVPSPLPNMAAQPFAAALEDPERWDGMS